MKEIKVTCSSSDTIPLDDLIDFQGGLKTITNENLEKLKNSIIKHGITVPGFIWKSGKKNYVLDMHQRIKALQSLKEGGYKIPLIPIDYIQAKTKKEAKEKLLHISSQYGEFDLKGLDNFIIGLEINNINLVNTEIDLFKDFEPAGIEEQGKLDSLEPKIAECPKCGEKFEC